MASSSAVKAHDIENRRKGLALDDGQWFSAFQDGGSTK